jgi:hypothetical protein
MNAAAFCDITKRKAISGTELVVFHQLLQFESNQLDLPLQNVKHLVSISGIAFAVHSHH